MMAKFHFLIKFPYFFFKFKNSPDRVNISLGKKGSPGTIPLSMVHILMLTPPMKEKYWKSYKFII